MKNVLLSAALCCVSAVVAADAGLTPDVPTRARGARRVIVAHVLDVHAEFRTNRFGDQLIVSNVLLEVDETLKGAPAATVWVAVEGGTVGGLTLKVSDMPAVHSGDRGVFFLDDGADGVQVPHDRGRGVMKLAVTDRVEGGTLTLNEIRQQVRQAVGQVAR